MDTKNWDFPNFNIFDFKRKLFNILQRVCFTDTNICVPVDRTNYAL